ncbi:hypothetical protein [Paenibacillus herberti]|uniref:Uncharacterized protein n=1 Tax=Paenibacillus herberti TaxID=1619309 RepID=A0A229NWP0_9BACL|nr:hypothetical protein [Paenibacillus herberti]OXM14396.1 hypothetical protein CGZ75_15735 [Paenibacillus herberti]
MSYEDVNLKRSTASSLGIILVLFILLVVIVTTCYQDAIDPINSDPLDPVNSAFLAFLIDSSAPYTFILDGFSNRGILRSSTNQTIYSYGPIVPMIINDSRYGHTTARYNALNTAGVVVGQLTFTMDYDYGAPFRFSGISTPPNSRYTTREGSSSGAPAQLRLQSI